MIQRTFGVDDLNFLKANQPDWRVPEISDNITDGLKNAFARNDELSATILYALVIQLLSQGQHLDSIINDQNLLLNLLCAAALKDHRPSQSIIFRIYAYFQRSPPPHVESSKSLWLAMSVSEGAHFVSAELQRINAHLHKDSVERFRNSGGYNRFFSTSSELNPLDIVSWVSKEAHDSSNLTKPLNSRGDTALHIAAIQNQSPALLELLRISALTDINALNTFGETPLYRACVAGLTENVLQLLSRNADALLRPSEESPGCLHWIFQFDPEDINILVNELVSHGASVNARSIQAIGIPYYPFELPFGTALHWAVEMSAPEAVNALLRHRADACLRDGSDPYKFDQSVRHLDRILPHGICSVAGRPTLGLNAFDLAVKNRNYRILDILFSKSFTDVADLTDEQGHSALHRLDSAHWLYLKHGTRIWKPCIEGSKSEQQEAVDLTVALLREHGFQLDRLTRPQDAPEGYKFHRLTPLMMAVKRRNVDSIKSLVRAGANVGYINDTGKTALHAFGDDYQSLLGLQRAAITALLRPKPDVNVRDINGDSPLTMAARMMLTEVGLALLEHGADFCVRGSTATDVGYGQNVIGIFCRCEIHEKDERDEWMAMILTRFVFPSLGAPDKRIEDEVLTNAGFGGGNLLHFTAHHGLRRSCQLLLKAGMVDCNQLRRGSKIRRRDGIRGKIRYYLTPLDEALKKAGHKQTTWVSDFSATGMCHTYDCLRC